MADSSQASSAPDARAFVQEVLSRLPVALDGLPKEVLARLEERARAPDRRLMVGRYVVVGELGRGGMGVVYDAWDPGIERRVAIKTIEPDLVPEEDRDEVIERFKRETKIVGRLHHPGIVTIFDYGEERDPGGGVAGSKLYYYVMEYLEGQSLARVLRERRTLPDVDAVAIVAEILDALAVSHSAGVIHRDIKPSNIFLRGGSQALLLDFGIAKTGSVALTRQGQILGTPSYLAPERLREKESPVDGRADIFSLGVLLFTMITGEAPFVGEDVYDVIDKIAKTAHPKLARSTPSGQALSRVIDRMLAKRPEDRYANANEAAVALRTVLKLLRESNAAVDDLFVQGVQIREELPDALATEIATPSNALPALTDDDADTGRHAVELPKVPHPEMTDAASSETPVRMSELLGTRPELALQRETRELDKTAKRPPPLPPGRSPVAPRIDGPRIDGPRIDGPRIDGPRIDGPRIDGPRIDNETLDDSEDRAPGDLSGSAYDSLDHVNDETTDDQTVADPDAGKRGAPEMMFRQQLQAPPLPPQPTRETIPPGALSPIAKPANTKAPTGPVAPVTKSPSGGTPSPTSTRSPLLRAASKPAIEKQASPEHIVRASSLDHTEQKTEQDRGTRPVVRAAKNPPPRAKRSRIEASLVDEDDVVVKPAPLDALKPDELPTQTNLPVRQTRTTPAQELPAAASRRPSQNGAAFERPTPQPIPVAEDVVSSISDPAESREDITQGGVMFKDEDKSGEVPELDVPRSAAAVRRTFGARAEKEKPKSANKGVPIHVRMIGNVGSNADRMRMVRRRLFMLLAAMLAAVAVGLLLGRLKQRSNNEPGTEHNRVQIEPRAMKSIAETATGEPAIVKPPPATEILQEAGAALTEGKLEKAERLFDSAVRASAEKSPVRAQALLGRADVLRQLGNKELAIEVYKTLLAESPKSAESENARVALGELGVEIIQPLKRTPPPAPKKEVVSPAEGGGGEQKAAPEKPKAPEIASQEISASMSPEEKCRVLMAKHLNDRAGAVKALSELAREEPRIGCVYWHLGNSYRQMGDDRAALSAYRRFLEVEPNSEKRAAVEQKVKDLATKLEER